MLGHGCTYTRTLHRPPFPKSNERPCLTFPSTYLNFWEVLMNCANLTRATTNTASRATKTEEHTMTDTITCSLSVRMPECPPPPSSVKSGRGDGLFSGVLTATNQEIETASYYKTIRVCYVSRELFLFVYGTCIQGLGIFMCCCQYVHRVPN